ncbi:MAG: EFR1 family ferrodoxin [Tissierellia bacterium]|nr:EFR1 family ferrodoxin [Tissierellia bacterium]
MIYYFSGTGNSAHVAARLREKLQMEVVDLGARIRSGDGAAIVDEVMVLVTPTYGWRIPRLVEKYLREVSVSAERLYVVMTCGSSIGGAEHYARKLAADMGLAFGGIFQVTMPENYIALFDVPEREEAREVVRRGEGAIEGAAQTISKGEGHRERVNPLGHFLSRVVNGPFYHWVVKANKFYATDGCIGCGICEKRCVLQNIQLVEARPQWGNRCTHCMACINYCPVAAIEYGKKTRGKFRYTLEKLELEES